MTKDEKMAGIKRKKVKCDELIKISLLDKKFDTSESNDNGEKNSAGKIFFS